MIFIFGYGYTAKHLASKVSDKEIFATSRSLNSLQINQKNIRIIDPSETPNILEKYKNEITHLVISCLLYTSPSPRDRQKSRMPSSA